MSVTEDTAYRFFPSGSVDYLALAERIWNRRVFANARMLTENYRIKDSELVCKKCGSKFELDTKMLGQRLQKHVNSFLCIIGAKYDLHPKNIVELRKIREAFKSCPTPESRDKCLCGCGMYVKYGRSYFSRHYSRTREFRELRRVQWQNPEYRKKMIDARKESVKTQAYREKQKQRRELILSKIRAGIPVRDIAREMGYKTTNSVYTILCRIRARERKLGM